jgi:hypothetical protein
LYGWMATILIIYFATDKYQCLGACVPQQICITMLQLGYIVTFRPTAMECVDKHISMEMDSWKPTRYGTCFRGYERSTNISLDTDTLCKRRTE